MARRHVFLAIASLALVAAAISSLGSTENLRRKALLSTSKDADDYRWPTHAPSCVLTHQVEGPDPSPWADASISCFSSASNGERAELLAKIRSELSRK